MLRGVVNEVAKKILRGCRYYGCGISNDIDLVKRVEKVIYDQKLVVSGGRASAPYGMWDVKVDDLETVNWYLEMGNNEELEMCRNVEKRWMVDEFQNMTFGHVNKYVLNEKSLEKELREIVPYFVDVVRLVYHVMRWRMEQSGDVGYSLQDVYAYGPRSNLGIKGKGAIGISRETGTVWTPWGVVDTRVEHLPIGIPPDVRVEEVEGEGRVGVVSKFLMFYPPYLEVDEIGVGERERLKEKWKNIRDFVFLRMRNS